MIVARWQRLKDWLDFAEHNPGLFTGNQLDTLRDLVNHDGTPPDPKTCRDKLCKMTNSAQVCIRICQSIQSDNNTLTPTPAQIAQSVQEFWK